jgi:hypothetical protein
VEEVVVVEADVLQLTVTKEEKRGVTSPDGLLSRRSVKRSVSVGTLSSTAETGCV